MWPPGRGQFWPQGHNLNNFGRGHLDDAIYQIWKLWSLQFQTRRFLKIAFWKPIFWPRDLLMQPTGTVWTNLIGDHPGIIPVKFGQIPISSSREDVVWGFPYIIQCKIVTPGRGQFWSQGENLNNFGTEPLDDAIYQIWKPWALWFQTRRYLKIALWKPFFTPWPTYATNQNHLNNFCKGTPRDHSCWVWSNSH